MGLGERSGKEEINGRGGGAEKIKKKERSGGGRPVRRPEVEEREKPPFVKIDIYRLNITSIFLQANLFSIHS